MIRRRLVNTWRHGRVGAGRQNATGEPCHRRPAYPLVYDTRQRLGAAELKCDPQRGFSLLEVLVALILLSVGLLGLAGLQVTSLRHNVDSLTRSQATLAADAILERVRANKANALDYATEFADGVATSGDEASHSALATTDLAAWKSQLADTLPGGQGQIGVAGDSCSGRIANCRVTVTIRWFDKSDDATGQQTDTNTSRTQQFAAQTQL